MSIDDWMRLQAEVPEGTWVQGRVVDVRPFGVFVELESISAPGLLLVPEFGDDMHGLEIEDYPKVGEPVRAVVLQFDDDNRHVRLTRRMSTIAKLFGESVADGPPPT